MSISRRRFLEAGALGAGALAAGCAATPDPAPASTDTPAFLKDLTPMTSGVVPISDDERRGRIAKAQRLMEEQKLDAIFMEGTAVLGAPCENVDIAARKVIVDAGFGPGYKVPGLPHRTGHGIGLEGHEWTNFVLGNKTPLAPGMCFSDEPTVAIYGEFGIRLEDCLYMTESGPKFFTTQSISITQPFG